MCQSCVDYVAIIYARCVDDVTVLYEGCVDVAVLYEGWTVLMMWQSSMKAVLMI